MSDLRECIHRAEVSEPLLLQLSFNEDNVEPLLQLLQPHVSALTALKLTWYPSQGREAIQVDLGWLETFSLDQMQHISMDVTHCQVTTTELSYWLNQMPHLQSLTLRDLSSSNRWDNGTLCIPPLAELRQLYIRSSIPSHQLEVSVLPALTQFIIDGGDSELSSTWLPNLAGMTSLETLTWSHNIVPNLLEMTHHLPPQLLHLGAYDYRTHTLPEPLIASVCHNLMKLSHLSTLVLPHILFPEFFVCWMKSSHLTEMPGILHTQPDMALLFADVIPEMKQLKSLRMDWCINTITQELDTEVGVWLAPIVQQCTLLTELELSISHKDVPRFIPALLPLQNLEHLLLYGHPSFSSLPSAFYDLHFPHLTLFKTSMTIGGEDLSAFGDWLACHPGLTHLHLAFTFEFIDQSLETLSTCPSLYLLAIRYMHDEPLGEFWIRRLPPTLRRLTLNSDLEAELPSDHQLTHFQQEVFPNNIRRHQTLVELHTDWSALFWPSV